MCAVLFKRLKVKIYTELTNRPQGKPMSESCLGLVGWTENMAEERRRT